MGDMTNVIAPRSDQLNADNLPGDTTITAKIIKVDIRDSGEQKVSIWLEGQKVPYKPCKGMCRVLVSAWGQNSSNFVGKSLTLFRNPDVKYGGIAVGGIQISHASHIDHDMNLSVTISKGKRSPYKLRKLVIEDVSVISEYQQVQIVNLVDKSTIDMDTVLKAVRSSTKDSSILNIDQIPACKFDDLCGWVIKHIKGVES